MRYGQTSFPLFFMLFDKCETGDKENYAGGERQCGAQAFGRRSVKQAHDRLGKINQNQHRAVLISINTALEYAAQRQA